MHYRPLGTGATSPEQVATNAAAGQWEPSAEDLAALTAL
jgi:aryl-alcohol dehydrogenase-like predicted oxidoreductase